MERSGDNVIGGRYRLTEVKGATRFSETWAGADDRGNPVMVSLLRPIELQRFLQDMETAAMVRHPAVAPVLDYGVEGGRCFVVTERIDGVDLAELMASPDPLPAETVARYGEAAAAGLAALHASGLVHGRVRPKNMVRTDDSVVLVGAGYSGSMPRWSLTFGEPASEAYFLSPEQARGLEPDASSDVYALGASLYQLATGSAPFEAANAGEVANAHLKTHVVPPRSLNHDVPLALEGVILRALAKDPGRRFSSAEEMRRALAEIVQPAGEEAAGALTGVPAGARLRRPRLVEIERKAWWRRNAAWPALLVVPAVLLGVVAAVWATGALVSGTLVPDLRGMTLTQAEHVLDRTGLALGRVTADAGVDPGGPNAWVISQTPKGGGDTERGTKVDLRLGATHPTVPDLTGMTEEQAQATLSAAGFKAGDVTRVRRPGALDGTVVGQDPAAGAPLQRGGVVGLILASSRASGVPDVVGYLQSEAVRTLRRAGYTAVVQHAANSAPKGTVISQYPEAGQRAEPGAPVTIVVSDGESSPPDQGQGTI